MIGRASDVVVRPRRSDVVGAVTPAPRALGVGPGCDRCDMPTNHPDAPSPEADVTPDERKDAKLSRKEQARQLRRAAYLKAKEQRANDPRLIAIKEVMKQRQRAAYQAARERRKLAVAEQNRRHKEQQAKMREARDAAMSESLKPGTPR